MCDHVKQYKIPREFMYLSDSEEDKKKDKDEKNGKDKDSKDGENNASENESSSDDDEMKEAKAKEKWEKKLYKPTGPDGQGWGDFRKVTPQE